MTPIHPHASAEVVAEYADLVHRIDVLDGILAGYLQRKTHLEGLLPRADTLPEFMRNPYALLSASEEVELAILIERARDTGATQTDVELGRLARERFVLANVRLVASVVRATNGRGLEFADRMQAGLMGVMRATENFDPTLGNKFSTYATWWIRQSIGRAVANESRTVRLPVHFHDDVVQVRASEHRLRNELGREPTVLEVMLASGRNEETILEVRELDREMLDLDSAIIELDADIGRSSDRCDLAVEEAADAAAQVRAALAVLTDREADVLKRRAGFDDGLVETLDEIGQSYGVTRERVRQIEAKAKKKVVDLFAGEAA